MSLLTDIRNKISAYEEEKFEIEEASANGAEVICYETTYEWRFD